MKRLSRLSTSSRSTSSSSSSAAARRSSSTAENLLGGDSRRSSRLIESQQVFSTLASPNFQRSSSSSASASSSTSRPPLPILSADAILFPQLTLYSTSSSFSTNSSTYPVESVPFCRSLIPSSNFSTNVASFPAVVSPQQLSKSLRPTASSPEEFSARDDATIEDFVVVQASINEHGNQTFFDYRIPSAVLFDINACSNHHSRFSKMLPSSEQFERYVNALGISPSSHVIIYDPYPATFGFYAAPRVWWMFRVFGHHKVSVLDGGLRKWIQLSYPLESNPIAERRRKNKKFEFSSTFMPELITYHDEILDNIKTKKMQILDARTPEAFRGNSVHAFGASSCFDQSLGSSILSMSSHIPGASNLYFRSILDVENGGIKTNEHLLQLFHDAGINFRDFRCPPLMAYCHSGVAACSLALAAHVCGKEDVKIYDASWEEWSVGREKAI